MLKLSKKQDLKMMRGVYDRLLKSDLFSLKDCYKSYSYYKEKAFSYCKDLYNKYEGLKARIISYNSQAFTYAFIGCYEGKEAIFFITRCYDRVALIDDIKGI